MSRETRGIPLAVELATVFWTVCSSFYVLALVEVRSRVKKRMFNIRTKRSTKAMLAVEFLGFIQLRRLDTSNADQLPFETE